MTHRQSLIERLEATHNVNIPAIRGPWDNSPRMAPVNPDGPEAAALIREQDYDIANMSYGAIRALTLRAEPAARLSASRFGHG
jgi:hypothetical protein